MPASRSSATCRRHRHGSNSVRSRKRIVRWCRRGRRSSSRALFGRRVRDEARVVLLVYKTPSSLRSSCNPRRWSSDSAYWKSSTRRPKADIGSWVSAFSLPYLKAPTTVCTERGNVSVSIRGAGFVVDCCELGEPVFNLEGTLLQVGAFEGFIVDGAHTGGHLALVSRGREAPEEMPVTPSGISTS